MTDGHPRPRDELSDPGRGRLDGLDPVVDVEHLPAAVDLAGDGVPDQPVVVLRDAGQDGQPGLGRGLDHAQVADADQAQVERPRNGGGGQGQHVHLASQLLDLLLLPHPEPLLLVDHQQPEVGE